MKHPHPLTPTTTLAPAHHVKGIPSIGSTVASFLPLVGSIALLWALVWVFFTLLNSKAGTGGKGKVVGVVGRMGSGKSYFAVRMAMARLKKGSHVASNFSLYFDKWCKHHEGEYRAYGRIGEGWCYRCGRTVAVTAAGRLVAHGRLGPKNLGGACKGAGAPVNPPDKGQGCKTCTQALGMASRWVRFTGWEQIAELEDCVVIVDEAHLYAPSNKHQTFPDLARWKLSMARKYGLDLYWITQHENRVNSVLRSLTNMIYVCTSWGDGTFFTAKGYEPELIRRKKKHLHRAIYRLNIRVATLYNTLEIIESDGIVISDTDRISELARSRNGRRAVRQVDEDRFFVADAARSAGRPRVGQVVVKPAPAAVSVASSHPVGMAPRPFEDRHVKCAHEAEAGDRVGTCRLCAPCGCHRCRAGRRSEARRQQVPA